MFRAFLLTAALIAAAPAAAQEWPAPSRILVPPSRFDHRLEPYQGSVTVRNVPRARLAALCDLGPRVLACAIVHSASRCTIYLPQGAPIKLRKAMLRHELGHCKGWKHPDRTH